MSDKLHLLTLPLEIRCHIYSFIYLEDLAVKFLGPKSHYTETALFLSCRQFYHETLEYYYGKNTFSLPVCQRFAMSDWSFIPRHFNLVKVLLLEANTFFWKSPSDSAQSSQHTKKCQKRLRNYLEALFWVNQGMLAPKLKILVFADRMPINDVQWCWNRDTDKLLDTYLQIFESMQIEVGQVEVEVKEDGSSELEDSSDTLDL